MRKKLLFGASLAMACLSLTSCHKTPIEEVEGRWLLEMADQTTMGVDINSDGTGNIDISGKGLDGKNHLIMMEDVKITSEDNDLYLEFVNNPGQKAHLYVKDGELYSDDNQKFRRAKNK